MYSPFVFRNIVLIRGLQIFQCFFGGLVTLRRLGGKSVNQQIPETHI